MLSFVLAYLRPGAVLLKHQLGNWSVKVSFVELLIVLFWLEPRGPWFSSFREHQHHREGWFTHRRPS